jgi:hypothetical protein
MGKAIYCDRCGEVKKMTTINRDSIPEVIGELWMPINLPDFPRELTAEMLLCPACKKDFERFMQNKKPT